MLKNAKLNMITFSVSPQLHQMISCWAFHLPWVRLLWSQSIWSVGSKTGGEVGPGHPLSWVDYLFSQMIRLWGNQAPTNEAIGVTIPWFFTEMDATTSFCFALSGASQFAKFCISSLVKVKVEATRGPTWRFGRSSSWFKSREPRNEMV